MIPALKNKIKFFDLDRVKLEIADELARAKKVEINMDVEHWKRRYLFPFANIAPIPDIEEETSPDRGGEEGLSASDKIFRKLVSSKYQFPI